MKEHPILFSAPMVRALLAGTKTQTRRVAKPRKYPSLLDGQWADEYVLDAGNRDWLMRDCPYGQPGDRLWVRETFKEAHPVSFQPGRVGERRLRGGIPGPPPVDYLVAYRADGELLPYWHSDEYPFRALQPRDDLDLKFNPHGCETGWDSPIHMPRAASRLTLEITGVRVERLQSISDDDCAAEGCPCMVCGRAMDGRGEGDCHCFHRKAGLSDYRELWQSINGPGSWDANPWVWVVEFRRIGGER